MELTVGAVIINQLLSQPRAQYKLMPPFTQTFVGREDYLQRLHDFFAPALADPRRRRVFLLYGLGGVGKTQICLKFLEEYTSL